jgi:CheY-like chemotaxis protein
MAGPTTDKPFAAATRRRLLVVDDNQDSAESMAILLGAQGHEIHVAYDGPSALSKAVEVRPQLILLDIGLPDMDGYEVIKQMRAEPALTGAVIAAMTGYGQDEDRALSRAAGFDHHLVKPVPMELVIQLIEALPPAA